MIGTHCDIKILGVTVILAYGIYGKLRPNGFVWGSHNIFCMCLDIYGSVMKAFGLYMDRL